VTCLSFNADATTLAVGRENGDIELWNVACGWLCERVLPGSGESTVQSLLWSVARTSREQGALSKKTENRQQTAESRKQQTSDISRQ
jgi:WD40 repeat protein